MESSTERNFGPQPLMSLMEEYSLKAHDLVTASPTQMTHKMVTRAAKGRRLTKNTMRKVTTAFSRATGQEWVQADLFNYEPSE